MIKCLIQHQGLWIKIQLSSIESNQFKAFQFPERSKEPKSVSKMYST